MLREQRLIIFDNTDLRTALELADLKLHKLPNGLISKVEVVKGPITFLKLEIAGNQAEFPVSVAIDCMIQYCINLGIPLPMSAQKRLLMSNDQLALELRS